MGSRDAACRSFRRSRACLDSDSLATTPTRSSVPEVRVHASLSPANIGNAGRAVSVDSASDPSGGRAYTESGGKSLVDCPHMDEYVAEASKYGSGMSRLVNASGKENHDAEPAGMAEMLSNLGNVGLYAECVDFAGRPRSDSPLGLLLFIGDQD